MQSTNSGHPLERRIAAVHQQSGFFVERNHYVTPSLSIELDGVATRYPEESPNGLDRVIIEGTKGKDGSATRARLLVGDVHILGYERGLLVTRKQIDEPLRRLMVNVGNQPVDLLDVDSEEEVGERLVAAGLCTRADSILTDAWIACYEVIDALCAAIKSCAANEDPFGAQVKKRLRGIQADLWIEPDLIERLRRLELLDWNKNLTQAAARHWPNPAWGTDSRYVGLNALNDREALVLNGVAYLQWLERINLAKAVADAASRALRDPAMLQSIKQVARAKPHLRFPGLVVDATQNMDVVRYMPAVVQAFVFGLGGFIWEYQSRAEFEWMAEHACCDRETAQRALDYFVKQLVSYEREWWRTNTWPIRPLKWFPLHLHGAGVLMRDEVLYRGNGAWPGREREFWVSKCRGAAELARASLKDPEAQEPKRPIVRRVLPAAQKAS